MAEDTANHITTFLLEIDASNAALLGHIRHWDNLKGAIDGTTLWIKDITPHQANSIDVQGIPYKTLYYQKENLLFLKDSLLPVKKMRSVLLWSPLDRVLPVSIPSLNHNFFGIQEKVAINIVPSITEHEPYALLLPVDAARNYIESAPQVRLQNIMWVGIDNNILLVGSPLLPITGPTYWQQNNMLLPTGFDLQFPILSKILEDTIDVSGTKILLWQPDGSYALIPKDNFRPLSISSFRLTYPTV